MSSSLVDIVVNIWRNIRLPGESGSNDPQDFASGTFHPRAGLGSSGTKQFWRSQKETRSHARCIAARRAVPARPGTGPAETDRDAEPAIAGCPGAITAGPRLAPAS